MSAALDRVGTIQLVSRDNYISSEFAAKEKQNLWSRVWQVACRVEEVPNPGDFVVYDVADDTIIVTRNKSGAIVAYHNVCPHRGRRLAVGCGHTNQFRCNYHGWTFNLDGKNVAVQDRDDWKGGLDDQEIDLQHVKVDTWGGFVWINMDPKCETLKEYLEKIPEYLDPYEYENMRFRWYVTAHINCNWKVALEAFMEGYHVAATHPQLLPIQGDDYTQSYAHGKHAFFGYWESKIPMGMPSPRLKQEWPKDPRDGVYRFFEIYDEQLKAIFTDRDCAAGMKIKDAVPDTVDAMTAFVTAVEMGRKAAEDEGCGYPKGLSWEHLAKAGADWHVFPNCVTLPWFDGALWYRARPDGDNPDKCIFDIWSLQRYSPGKEPKLERKVLTDVSGKSVGSLILDQDIANMEQVQRGMKSRAFTMARPNPLQEVEVINFHRTLERYLQGR